MTAAVPPNARGARLATAADEDAGSGAPGDVAASPRVRKRWHTVLGASIMVVVGGAIIGGPWWVPRALSEMAFFRVRRIEIDGARYASPTDLIARLRVDTTASVWNDLDVLGRRVATHPLVTEAHVERRLPSTLHVVVVERTPVAMTPSAAGVSVLAADGRVLPIDPSRVGGVDVPLLAARDTLVLRVLGAMRRETPAVFARVSEVQRAGADEVRFSLSQPSAASTVSASRAPLIVRAALDVTPARFADLIPVEGDLARRCVRATEIDLRFRDQVIARLP